MTAVPSSYDVLVMIVWKVLGSFRVEVDGRPVDTGGRLARMVLVQLLLARGAVVPTERIIERLWPTRVPSSAQGSLQAYVARLRRVLEPERAPRTPARLLVSAPYGYALAVEQDAVDAWAFESRVATCSEAGLPARVAALRADILPLEPAVPTDPGLARVAPPRVPCRARRASSWNTSVPSRTWDDCARTPTRSTARSSCSPCCSAWPRTRR